MYITLLEIRKTKSEKHIFCIEYAYYEYQVIPYYFIYI